MFEYLNDNNYSDDIYNESYVANENGEGFISEMELMQMDFDNYVFQEVGVVAKVLIGAAILAAVGGIIALIIHLVSKNKEKSAKDEAQKTKKAVTEAKKAASANGVEQKVTSKRKFKFKIRLPKLFGKKIQDSYYGSYNGTYFQEAEIFDLKKIEDGMDLSTMVDSICKEVDFVSELCSDFGEAVTHINSPGNKFAAAMNALEQKVYDSAFANMTSKPTQASQINKFISDRSLSEMSFDVMLREINTCMSMLDTIGKTGRRLNSKYSTLKNNIDFVSRNMNDDRGTTKMFDKIALPIINDTQNKIDAVGKIIKTAMINYREALKEWANEQNIQLRIAGLATASGINFDND